MGISAELHRQQIGLFHQNSARLSRKKTKLTKQISVLNLKKLFAFLLNILSLNTDIFLLFSLFFTEILSNFDPLTASFLGCLSTAVLVNVCQIVIIIGYISISTATTIFYLVLNIMHIFGILEILLFSYYYNMLILLCQGDIETNPGPSPIFTFAHWNLNSLPAHDFSRVSLLETFFTQEKLSLMAITESALKPDVPDKKLK